MKVKRRITNKKSAAKRKVVRKRLTVRTKNVKITRKRIRKVISYANLDVLTKRAEKCELYRKIRVNQAITKYKQIYDIDSEITNGKLVLDVDFETKNELLSVASTIVKRLMPHQANAVKFMFDCCFESIAQLNVDSGSGCILAHCMGTGKTFSVVALSHTLITNPQTNVKKILIIGPLSVILNWKFEFKEWVLEDPNVEDINIYELTRLKKIEEKIELLLKWHSEGGVMILGYDMYRRLVHKIIHNDRLSMQQTSVKECLINPGPDLVICDEGHLLKNGRSQLNDALSNIQTRRRIILTGTPLQNNLMEYYWMVNFVKPHLLGNIKEFRNQYVNPINNGQYADSTRADIDFMNRRAYVLNKQLSGCIHRANLSVLQNVLPPKEEYVIKVRLTDLQKRLYKHYIEELSVKKKSSSKSEKTSTLFQDFHWLSGICAHPWVLQSKSEIEADSDSEQSEDEMIDTEESDSEGSDIYEPKKNPPTAPFDWWSQFCTSDDLENMHTSSKLPILFSIIAECGSNGEKLLVFSQSLLSLKLIEKHLKSFNWIRDKDYFYFDGKTNIQERKLNCDIFNDKNEKRARLFLISTRAGGLGINLTGASRAVLFDASWNPSNDTQSVFRIYRIHQRKPCYIYRLIALGTMEELIYKRQVTKLSLSKRIIDAKQTDRHFEENDLARLYSTEGIDPKEDPPEYDQSKDDLLCAILQIHSDVIHNFHIHDSLLEEKNENLTYEDKRNAWKEFSAQRDAEKNKMLRGSMKFLSILNDSKPVEVEERSIYGFTTSQLHELLSYKLGDGVLEKMPSALAQLHRQMAEGNTELYDQLVEIDNLFK
ncbi:transcriptional regulator ATRX homolog isoform X2 [Contarinia nasturtii]|uniref:transcriptional regulator ATRX homolog isoform X2 n=1 Tax=Contarinia nasturtii TaxID=265458 RepID=UPI0012D3B1B2|nr:transcriptional regulator ATRX homolog isoform X2 [Contarinia nasturtii]